ncbi:T9SS sorting signal type C domain-containing protein [Hwangdonia sp.]|uniref:T9SS sorting signal type C domain-containing protein n=1 Tax=Hwangdonia sp. TaxID=1883432 RepID=UPI003AB85DC2
MKKITFTKSVALFFTFLGVIGFGYGQTTLAKEDIAIIGVNTDNEDFTFLLRTDITTGTQIYFSDNEVNAAGTGLLDTNEGLVLFTALSDYSCGTVLGFIANSSEFTVIDNTFALANGGDEVLAFQGYNAITDEWTTFLHANVDATLTNLPIGFTSSDIVDGTQDNREYNGSTANPSWTDLNSIANYDQANDYSSVTLSTAAFACVACSLTVTWNGTWSGTPSSSTEVVIEANYRTGNSVNEINFSACSLTINNGAILTIDNGGYVEVENDVLVNDGAIRVESQGNFVQNDNSGSFTLGVSGTANVNKVTPAKQDWLHYTYWSSPVENWTIADAFPFTPTDRRFWFNAANYLDEHTVNTANGVPDDIDDNNDAWQYALGTDVMLPGVGYAATAGPFHTPGGTDSADFSGVFNTGDKSTSISYNALNTLGSWNFIGNPYPSAIDFIAFQAANSTVIDGAAYFWSQASPPSSANPGNQVQNFDLNDYAVYTVGSGGVAGGTPDEPTQYIPSAQGFFVAGLSNGSVTFTNSIRMADGTSNTLFFKNANSKKNAGAVANKLWVNLTSDNGVFNQILVSYVDGATKGNDGMSYDAPKFLSNTVAVLYTSMENIDKKFAIQGKAPSDLNENEIIDLGFKTAIDVETLYTFSIAQFQGAFLNNNPVFLIDNLLNKIHDLKVCDYSFTSEVGEFNNRFQIAFSDKALSSNDFGLNDNALKIIELANDYVNFKLSDNLRIKSVTIFDLLGRQLYNLKGANSSETYQLSKLKNTVYIAKVELSNGAIITKKAIKQ